MFVPNEYMTLKLAARSSRELSRRAECRSMLRRAGLDERGWIEFGFCKVVCALGRLLVALGKRLERVNGPAVAAPRASSA